MLKRAHNSIPRSIPGLLLGTLAIVLLAVLGTETAAGFFLLATRAQESDAQAEPALPRPSNVENAPRTEDRQFRKRRATLPELGPAGRVGSAARSRLVGLRCVRAKILPVMGLHRGDQFLAGLGLQRSASIDFAHPGQDVFRNGPGKHPQRPGEIGPIEPPQLVEPHADGTDAPGGGPPPAVQSRTQVKFPALQD